jgi:hypothetical protein
MDLLPDQLEALKQSAGNSSIVAAAGTGLDPDNIGKFVDLVKEFVKAHKTFVQNKHFSFGLGKTSGTAKVTKALFASELSKGNTIITVDENFMFLSAQKGDIKVRGSQERSKSGLSVELLCWGTYAFYLAAGVVLEEEDLSSAKSDPPTLNPWRRPVSSFAEMLEDHMQRVVRREQGIKYWKDKKKRILLNPEEGTERIFHRSLYWWLRENVADLIRIAAETRGFGQDATDILIVTAAGSFIVEVKWLGDNGSKKYDRVRINQGLLQVKLYLDNDKTLVWGHLVCYDGRSEQEHQKESYHDASMQHKDCEDPTVLFLENKTPSEIADAIKR